MNTSRRTFLIAFIGTASSLAWGGEALADAPILDESDPQARQYGYKQVAAKVDASRFAAYKAGQTCATCSLFDGKAGEKYGGCAIFGNKQVAAAGWCSAYATL